MATEYKNQGVVTLNDESVIISDIAKWLKEREPFDNVCSWCDKYTSVFIVAIPRLIDLEFAECIKICELRGKWTSTFTIKVFSLCKFGYVDSNLSFKYMIDLFLNTQSVDFTAVLDGGNYNVEVVFI